MFERGIEIKTPAQIETMREAGLVVGRTLALLRETAAAGMKLNVRSFSAPTGPKMPPRSWLAHLERNRAKANAS